MHHLYQIPGASAELLNRETSGSTPSGEIPEFYQLAVKGEFPLTVPLAKLPPKAQAELRNRASADGNITILQVVDDAALTALENSATGALPLLVDYDHVSRANPGPDARAAGWITKLEKRDNGLYGKIAWTPRAKVEVQGHEFSFISPVFLGGETLTPLGGTRFRVTQINGAGITNRPNIRSLAPLTDLPNRDTPGEEPTTQTPNDNMKDVAKALGLQESATGAEVLAAVNALKSGKTELENRVTTLNAEVLENRKQQASALCEKHGITDPAKRKDFEAIYLENSALAGKFLELLPAPAAKAGAKPGLTQQHPAKEPVLENREKGTDSTGEPELLNRAKARANENKIPLDEAIAEIAGEEPELYNRYTESLKPTEGK